MAVILLGGRIGAQEPRAFLAPEEAEFLVRSVAVAAEGSMRIDGRDSIKAAAPYAARVGMIATVLNRLSDPRFPNSVPQIIASDRAFSPIGSVASGVLAAEISDYDMEITYAALDSALRGFDPTGGALCFSTTADESRDFTVTFEIDGYSFGVPKN